MANESLRMAWKRFVVHCMNDEILTILEFVPGRCARLCRARGYIATRSGLTTNRFSVDRQMENRIGIDLKRLSEKASVLLRDSY